MSIVGLDPGEERRWREGGKRGEEGQRRGEIETRETEGGRGDAGYMPHHTSYKVTDWKKREMCLFDSTGIQKRCKRPTVSFRHMFFKLQKKIGGVLSSFNALL